ncbi:MAG: sensor histidine kinase [Massilia sp.]
MNVTAPLPSRHHSFVKAALVIVAVWTILCALGALSSYVDRLQQGHPASYALMLGRWWRAHILMMIMSVACYRYLALRPAVVASARAIARTYGLLLLLFLPLELAYVALLDTFVAEQAISVSQVWSRMIDRNGFGCFLEFAWITFTYAALVGICGLRERARRERVWDMAERDNLALRLELEQQRLLALRGQLEPHFLFNALNAISALVRSDDKRVALAGIGTLSDLLRYALQASERERVTLADECQFVSDYLSLQKLRYRERLHVHMDASVQAEIPPLLLQPLIENALRHDLDCHTGESDIRVAFAAEGEQLHIRVCNPCGATTPANPGLGMGLRQTRARLALAYGERASLSSGVTDGRYVVDISLPRAA